MTIPTYIDFPLRDCSKYSITQEIIDAPLLRNLTVQDSFHSALAEMIIPPSIASADHLARMKQKSRQQLLAIYRPFFWSLPKNFAANDNAGGILDDGEQLPAARYTENQLGLKNQNIPLAALDFFGTLHFGRLCIKSHYTDQPCEPNLPKRFVAE